MCYVCDYLFVSIQYVNYIYLDTNHMKNYNEPHFHGQNSEQEVAFRTPVMICSPSLFVFLFNSFVLVSFLPILPDAALRGFPFSLLVYELDSSAPQQLFPQIDNISLSVSLLKLNHFTQLQQKKFISGNHMPCTHTYDCIYISICLYVLWVK